MFTDVQLYRLVEPSMPARQQGGQRCRQRYNMYAANQLGRLAQW